MQRMWRLLAVAMAIMLVAAACNGDDDDAASDGGGDGAGADLSGQSLEVAAVWTGVEQERFEMVLAAFEEQTGADVTYTPAGDDMDVFLEGRIARGGAPDVAVVAQPALLRQLAENGNLVALDSDVEAAVDAAFDPGLKEALSVDGTLHGVPFKTANKSLLWHNVSVLEDAGVDPPSTWDEFQETAQTVLDSGVAPISLGADVGWPLSDWFENVLLWTAGGEFYDQLATGEASWDSDEVRTALATLAEIWRGEFLVGGNEGAASTTFDDSATALLTEPTGFMFEGDFVAGVISGAEVGEIGTDFDFAPFPAVIAEGAAAGGGGSGEVLGQEAGDQLILGGDFPLLLGDSEAGQALMEFLASAEAQEIWVAEGGFLSSNTNVDVSAYPDDVTRRAAELIENADATRFDLSDQVPPEFGGTVGQGIWSILIDFLSDPSDIDGTVDALVAAAP